MTASGRGPAADWCPESVTSEANIETGESTEDARVHPARSQ